MSERDSGTQIIVKIFWLVFFLFVFLFLFLLVLVLVFHFFINLPSRAFQVFRANLQTRGQSHRTAQTVGQFPHVARPGMEFEPLDKFRSQAQRFRLRSIQAQEMFGEFADILPALAQRRQRQGNHVQPVKQVGAKRSLGHHLRQPAVGGGDDAHVHMHGTGIAKAVEFPLLQHPQQLRLQAQRHLAYFV